MRTGRARLALALGLLLWATAARAEDGSDLWLRYPLVSNAARLAQYRAAVTGLLVATDTATGRATHDELTRGLRGLLGTEVPAVRDVVRGGILVASVPSRVPLISAFDLKARLARAGSEGYVIRTIARARATDPPTIVITAQYDVGVLYGAFAFLRLLQTHQPVDALDIVERPRLQHRILDHWDNAKVTGAIAGTNMAGGDVGYEAVNYFFSDVFDLALSAWGEAKQVDRRLIRGSTTLESPDFVEIGIAADGRVAQVLAINHAGEDELLRDLVGTRVSVTGKEEALKDPAFPLAELLRSRQ